MLAAVAIELQQGSRASSPRRRPGGSPAPARARTPSRAGGSPRSCGASRAYGRRVYSQPRQAAGAAAPQPPTPQQAGAARVGHVANDVAVEATARLCRRPARTGSTGERRRERAARPEPGDGPRGKGKPLAGPLEGQVEDQVFTIVEPLGIAADRCPGRAAEQHRPARRQECRGVDVLERRAKPSRPWRVSNVRARIGLEEATDDVDVGTSACG